MPLWIGPTVKWGILLALVLTVWAFIRWGLRRAEKTQAYQDEIDRLRRERAEDQKKLAAALAAVEELRAARRNPVSGLPADLSVQPREKPVSGSLGQSPTRSEAPTGPDPTGL